MKNDERIKSDVQDYIFTTALADEVSGVVKKDRRPMGSVKEDVIISVLANENGQNQTATVNVNIYVKDKPAGNQTDPDHERLDTLADMSQDVFNVFRGKSYRARLLSQRITSVGENEHVITNKIEYKQNNE
jgi:hypothetical protein